MLTCILTVFGISVIVIIFTLLYRKLTIAWDHSPTCLVGKTVIVTGANTGIGFYTAQDFAKRGAKVILACRSELKAKAAQTKIIEATGNSNILTASLDLASLESVRKFAQHIKSTENALHILVNNAGALWFGTTETTDGLNVIKQVNYFGPFLLTILLVDLLKKSAPSRILNLSSMSIRFASIDPNNLNTHEGEMKDYGQAKLLTVLFTNELASRLKKIGVVANSVNPGEVHTEIIRNTPRVAKYFTRLFFKTAEEGAQTSVYVAVSQDLENVTGKYFANCRESWLPLPKIVHDLNIRKQCFQTTLQLVKLSADETKQFDEEFSDIQNEVNPGEFRPNSNITNKNSNFV